MDWKSASRYPDAVELFRSWLKTADIVRGWSKHLAIDKPEELPHELAFGLLMAFFRSQEILFATSISMEGHAGINLHRHGKRGTYKRFESPVKRIDHPRAYGLAFVAAFRELHRRINGFDDSHPVDENREDVGLNIDDIHKPGYSH